MPSLPIKQMLSSSPPKGLNYRHWGDPPPPPPSFHHRSYSNSGSSYRHDDELSPGTGVGIGSSDHRVKRQRTDSLRAVSSEPGDDVTPG